MGVLLTSSCGPDRRRGMTEMQPQYSVTCAPKLASNNAVRSRYRRRAAERPPNTQLELQLRRSSLRSSLRSCQLKPMLGGPAGWLLEGLKASWVRDAALDRLASSKRSSQRPRETRRERPGVIISRTACTSALKGWSSSSMNALTFSVLFTAFWAFVAFS